LKTLYNCFHLFASLKIQLKRMVNLGYVLKDRPKKLYPPNPTVCGSGFQGILGNMQYRDALRCLSFGQD
jgi:hypothetical protein